MRLVTYRTPEGTQAGRVEGSSVVPLGFADVGALLAASATGAPAAGPPLALPDLDLSPVVVAPRKIFCLGLNYENHIREMGRELPEHPTIFGKFARCLIGPRDAIVLPAVSQSVDWEAELAFVIGREIRHAASPSEAAAAIAGYTVLNDVSVRDFQNRTLQWLQGKTFESSTPVGPWLVTPEEIPGGPEGHPDLAISCSVDGQTKQSSRTSDLLFTPADIVAYLSQIITLEPGDLIATGTPGGVGHACRPPVYLVEGQTVVTTIEGIGELVNPTVAEQR